MFTMESVAIENNLDKQCGALGGLFQQVMTEMKNGAPNFEEFISKAGKLHTTLRSTILVLGSFLDSFQKIADSASNTKGTTRDIGTCLTRIVIRHRALESRMKTLAGALMDCLVLPIQGKLDEWKKVALILDKEHSKGYKKNRNQIKKKYDQVVRLRKKLKKDKGGTPDPSVQRLFDQCSKDLNSYFRTFEKSEKSAVRRVLLEDRNRYCTFVAFLKPVLDEELSMLSEIQQIEEVMSKLTRTASLEESTDVIIDDFVNAKVQSNKGSDENTSLYLPTPPSTPYMGSRNNSMSSIASDSTATNSSISINFIGSSPSRGSIQSDVMDYDSLNIESNSSRPSSALSHNPTVSPIKSGRPSSAKSWSEACPSRPHTISSSFNKGTAARPALSVSTFTNHSPDSERPSESQGFSLPSPLNQCSTFSTIKRLTHSPFPRNQPPNPLIKRPPLPTQTSSLNRTPKSDLRLGRYVDENSCSSPHYATPKSTFNLQLVPNFISDSQDMIIPHPVYINSKKLDNLKISSPKFKQKNTSKPPDTGSPQFESSNPEDDEDLKTPVVEELSFNGGQTGVPKEDGSGSSSDSFGSSSGYGSQYTIRFDDHVNSKPFSHSSPSRHHSESHPKVSCLTNALCSSSNDVSTLKAKSSDSNGQFLSPSGNFIHGFNTLLSSKKPTPPIRRSSFGNSEQHQCSQISTNIKSEDSSSVDDDPTPRGSVENLSPVFRASSGSVCDYQRSTSVSDRSSPVTVFEKDGTIRRFYQKGEKKASSLDECNYIQSPGLRANLGALNSFVQSSIDKKPSSSPAARTFPTSIKAEIESALEQLRTKGDDASKRKVEASSNNARQEL